MGKSLIIKGADFSQVAVEVEPTLVWLIDSYKDEKSTTKAVSSAGWFIPANYSLVQGKTVNRIKLKIGNTGRLTIGVADGVGAAANITQKRVIDLSAAIVDSVAEVSFDDIEVPNNGYICICDPVNDTTNMWYFLTNGTDGVGFYTEVSQQGATGEVTNVGEADLNISFGYYGNLQQ